MLMLWKMWHTFGRELVRVEVGFQFGKYAGDIVKLRWCWLVLQYMLAAGNYEPFPVFCENITVRIGKMISSSKVVRRDEA
jgi:hypothetical protein